MVVPLDILPTRSSARLLGGGPYRNDTTLLVGCRIPSLRAALPPSLVGSVRQPQRALMGVGVGGPVVVRHAAAAMRLDGIVDDLERHIGRLDLDHGDFLLGALVADLVHHVGGLEAQQARHVDVDPGEIGRADV